MFTLTMNTVDQPRHVSCHNIKRESKKLGLMTGIQLLHAQEGTHSEVVRFFFFFFLVQSHALSLLISILKRKAARTVSQPFNSNHTKRTVRSFVPSM